MQMNFASYASLQAVTPSDATLLNCRALLVNVTVAGNVVVNTAAAGAGGVTIALPIGLALLPIELNEGRVMATGLTATATFTALA